MDEFKIYTQCYLSKNGEFNEVENTADMDLKDTQLNSNMMEA